MVQLVLMVPDNVISELLSDPVDISGCCHVVQGSTEETGWDSVVLVRNKRSNLGAINFLILFLAVVKESGSLEFGVLRVP